jgi:hypothetical protein
MPLIHGTLREQLARSEREIERCQAYLDNPENPDRFGAELGLLDWLVNREDVRAEIARETNSRKENEKCLTR